MSVFEFIEERAREFSAPFEGVSRHLGNFTEMLFSFCVLAFLALGVLALVLRLILFFVSP